MAATPPALVDASVKHNVSAATSLTKSITIGDNVERYLLVGFTNSLFQSVTSVTFGGVAMSAIITEQGFGVGELSVYAMTAPPVGAADVVITLGGASNIQMVAVSLYRVDQTTPVASETEASGNSDSPSVAVTSVADQLIVDFLGFEGSPASLTKDASQTLLQETSSVGADWAIGASYEVAVGASTVMSWSAPGADDWRVVGIPVNFSGSKDTDLLAEVDWNNDNDFSDASEDVSADVLDVSWLRGRGGVTAEFGGGAAQITLNNKSGDYSPYDAAAALFANLLPGRKMRISIVYLGIRYGQFTGYIGEISERRRTQEAVPKTILSCVDMTEKLSRGSLRIGLQEDQRIDQLLETVRGETQLTASEVNFDTARTTLPVWWSHQASPMESFRAAAREEPGAHLFVDKDGILTWKNRLARAAEVSIGTFALQRELSASLRLDDFADEVRIRRSGIMQDTTEQLIFSMFPIGRAIQPGVVGDDNLISGEYPLGSARNVQTPEPTKDYLFNTQEDGEGNDVTSQVSVFAFVNSGGGFQLRWANSSGKIAYHQKFEIRGDPIRISGEDGYITKTNTSAPVRDRAYTEDYQFNDDGYELGSYALIRLDVMSRKLPRPSFAPTRRSSAEIIATLSGELGSRVTLQNLTGRNQTKIDDEFFLESIEGRLTKGADVIVSMMWELSHQDLTMGNFFRMSSTTVSNSQLFAAAAVEGAHRIGF